MARPSKTSVRIRRLTAGRTAYHLRGTWRGQRFQYALGYSPEWDEHRADAEAQTIQKLIDVDRWDGPPKKAMPAAAGRPTDPTMNEVISDWWAKNLGEQAWEPNTVAAYGYQVRRYLKWWANHRCSQISIHELDRWLAWLNEQTYRGTPLSVSYRNAIIERLAQVLDYAWRREWVQGNVARLPEVKVPRPKSEGERRFHYLNVDQLLGLLAAAQQLDDGVCRRVSSKGKPYVPNRTSTNLGRVALIGLLYYAGLRIHEAGNLLWPDVLLDEGVVRIRRGKTLRGVREPNIVPALTVILSEWQARTRHSLPTDFVCPTYRGDHRSNRNIDQRVLAPSYARARGNGLVIPAEVTSHWGRRTFATNLAAVGETADYIQDQLGHEDSRLAQELYRQRRNRRTAPDPRLFELYGQAHHLRPAA